MEAGHWLTCGEDRQAVCFFMTQLVFTQEDDLKDADVEPQGERWWHAPWVHHMCIWVPILISACLLVTGIVLVVFFQGRV